MDTVGIFKKNLIKKKIFLKFCIDTVFCCCCFFLLSSVISFRFDPLRQTKELQKYMKSKPAKNVEMPME